MSDGTWENSGDLTVGNSGSGTLNVSGGSVTNATGFLAGDTDSVGTEAYNQKLSADRAEAVRAWLVAHGVAADRLSAAGFGDTKPTADNANEEGRAKNRRVELVRQ